MGHGFLQSKKQFEEYRKALVTLGFTVIVVDVLGHGESDKPDSPELYSRERMAAYISSVLDAEDIKQAHYIGYSMGGNIGASVAQFCPQRLLSLTIGGWSPRPGPQMVQTTFEEIDDMMVKYKMPIPEEAKPAMRACHSQFLDVAGVEAALKAVMDSGTPLQFWLGKNDDDVYPFAKGVAESLGCPILEVEGHRVSAVSPKNDQALDGLIAFLK